MRIISSFYDYYDKGVAYGIDPKQIYARETKEIVYEHNDHGNNEVNNELFLAAKNMPKFSDYNCGVIGFCGKIYPWYTISVSSLFGTFYHKTYYSIIAMQKDILGETFKERVLNFLWDGKSIPGKKGIISDIEKLQNEFTTFLNGKVKHYWHWTKVSPKHFDKEYVGKEIGDSLFIKYNSPILLVYGIGFSNCERTIYINPKLYEFTFITQFDPIAAFQEISMYIGNNMAKQADPNDKFTDNEKRDQAGFDNWSFRKHKFDKRNLK